MECDCFFKCSSWVRRKKNKQMRSCVIDRYTLGVFGRFIWVTGNAAKELFDRMTCLSVSSYACVAIVSIPVLYTPARHERPRYSVVPRHSSMT